MKQLVWLLLVAAVNLSGCVAYFKYPLSNPRSAEIDPELLGMWVAVGLDPTTNGGKENREYKYSVLHIRKYDYEDGHMRVIAADFDTNPEPPSISFKGFVTKIDNVRYMNLQSRVSPDPENLTKASNVFEKAEQAYDLAYEAFEKAEALGESQAINSAAKNLKSVSKNLEAASINLAKEKVKYAGPYLIVRYDILLDGRLGVGYINSDGADEFIEQGRLEAEEVRLADGELHTVIQSGTNHLRQFIHNNRPRDLFRLYKIYERVTSPSAKKMLVTEPWNREVRRCLGTRRPPRCR